ncbi:MAG: ubiquinone/menaquinone biosynthesis methyltransferase [Anaerolineae bacterium]|nr:ubiquinone/menaquinone biosynthesis methyltransferase [Anaerolineae bacterium]MDW8098335.1 ubiquinone/menaquinone biosynthesis methyltransferase [Anaerolineae bacterium]
MNRMFAAIARRYDLMNRLMTGGRDRAWRQYVIRLAQLPPGGWLLDVATGTGEIGYEALRQVPDAHVVGVDFTHEMILIGQQKRHRGTIQFVEGNACRLPFADDAFDVVTSGFAMRNVADIHTAFAEQRRVAKPGGRVICLETTPPPHGLWGAIYRLYFFHLVPIVGGLLTGRRDAYAYLPRSTERFPSPEALKAIMEAVGLRHVRYRPLTLGTVVVHMGIK